MKYGTVLIIGRPNVGKSTFVNNVIGQKVSITSPKPQTTRFPIQGIYEDTRGKIIFIDTPGIFGKAEDTLSRKINQTTTEAINNDVDVVIYMVDTTRRRDFEEGKVLGLVRKLTKPYKILVLNKVDIKNHKYVPQYTFLDEEVEEVHAISALTQQHVKPLLESIFDHLPQQENPAVLQDSVYPVLNIDSNLFIAELIREKVFLHTGREVPYTTTVIVEDISEKENGVMYIKANLITTKDRYKKMLIGTQGQKIRELGRIARKEIELAINKQVYLDMTVTTDPHWQNVYY